MEYLLTWLISVWSITGIFLMGNKWKYAPAFGFVGQILWFYFIITQKHWGLVLGAIGYTLVHLRNHIKWIKEDSDENQKVGGDLCNNSKCVLEYADRLQQSQHDRNSTSWKL